MRSKSTALMNQIIDFIDLKFNETGLVPSMQEIAVHFEIGKTCVWNYVKEMQEKGMLEYNSCTHGIKTPSMMKLDTDSVNVPLVGTVACGKPILAEENIETYLPIPTRWLGKGKYFILKASGESMINAGISSGDYVIVKKQDSADEGQIVVALIDDEATLKIYYIDKNKKKIRLHPENDTMQDMYFDNVVIQGVAVKVLKNLI